MNSNVVSWTGENPPALTAIGNVTGVGAFGLSLFQTATPSEARALLGVNTDPFGVTTITVGTGGDYATVGAALTGITDASSSKRYVILLISDCTEPTALVWKDWISLDFNSFRVTVTDASSAAGLSVLSPITNAWFFNGELYRTTSTATDVYALTVNTTAGNSVRFVGLRIQNTCTGIGSYAINVYGGCNCAFLHLNPVVAATEATASVIVTDTSSPSFQNCQLRGIISRGSAIPFFGNCVNSGSGGPALLISEATVVRVMGGHWSHSGTILGIVANGSGSLIASNLYLGSPPAIRTSTVMSATTSVAMAGQIYSIAVNVSVAFSAAATLVLGTTAGASDIMPAIAIDAIGDKQITVATQPLGTGTVYATIVGSGGSLTLNLTSMDQTANCYPISLNGTGEIVFSNCYISSNPQSHCVQVSAISATANRAKFSNCVIEVTPAVGVTTIAGFNAVSAWTNAVIKNCTIDATLQYVNVTPIVDAAVSATQVRRCSKLGEIKNAYGMAVITNDDRVISWGEGTNGVYSIGEVATGIPSANMFNGTRTGKLTKLVGNRSNIATLTDTNELWIKGANDVGQLGLGDTTNTGIRYRAFHRVTISGKTIVNVWIGGADASSTYFVVLCSDGTGFSWGYNGTGQLCVNNTTNYSSPQPVAIPAGSSAFAEFSLAPIAGAHTIARTTDNKVHLSGNNNYGQLGTGDTTQRNQLTTVTGKLVTAIQALGTTDSTPTHIGSSQIVLTSGAMQMCGYNAYGHLGINSTTASNVFVNTTLNHTDVSKLAINYLAGQALGGYVTATKIAWLAGYNGYGNLGNGNTTNSSVYIQPSGAFQGLVDKLIVAYPNGPSVILANGEVWCSGYGALGNNGDGATANRTTFARVPMVETIVDIAIANANNSHTTVYALGMSGRMYSWGYNVSYGMAGQGHLNAVYVPCEVRL